MCGSCLYGKRSEIQQYNVIESMSKDAHFFLIQENVINKSS